MGQFGLWLDGTKTLTALLRDSDLALLPQPVLDLFWLTVRTFVRQRGHDPDPPPPWLPPPPAHPPRVSGLTYGDLLEAANVAAATASAAGAASAVLPPAASAVAAVGSVGGPGHGSGRAVSGAAGVAALPRSFETFLYLRGWKLRVEVSPLTFFPLLKNHR
jgi:hypothetical protein